MKRENVKKSLAASVYDGLCWSMMAGFAESYIVPLAMVLGAGVMQIGFLRTFPSMIGSLAQLFVGKIVAFFGGRRKAVVKIVLFQAVSIAIAGMCGLFKSSYTIYPFILFSTLYTVFGLLSTPPWTSLMMEYLPASKRGTFMGWRDRTLGVLHVFSGMMAAWFLMLFGRQEAAGFVMLFLAAGAFRMGSVHFISTMYEPANAVNREDKVGFIDFMLMFNSNNVALFTVISSAMYFAVYITAPYFAVYMIKDLGFPYWQYMAITMTSQLSNYLTAKAWGGMSDKYGSVAVIKFSVRMLPFIPLLWCCTKTWYLLCCIELFSGFIWSAFQRSSNNFIYDSVPSQLRTQYLSYYGVATGVSQFLGALVGGWLALNLPDFGWYGFITLLLITSALRVLALWPFLTRLREVKARPPVDRGFVLEAVGLNKVITG